jgi:hypothetical protein
MAIIIIAAMKATIFFIFLFPPRLVTSALTYFLWRSAKPSFSPKNERPF